MIIVGITKITDIYLKIGEPGKSRIVDGKNQDDKTDVYLENGNQQNISSIMYLFLSFYP